SALSAGRLVSPAHPPAQGRSQRPRRHQSKSGAGGRSASPGGGSAFLAAGRRGIRQGRGTAQGSRAGKPREPETAGGASLLGGPLLLQPWRVRQGAAKIRGAN